MNPGPPTGTGTTPGAPSTLSAVWVGAAVAAALMAVVWATVRRGYATTAAFRPVPIPRLTNAVYSHGGGMGCAPHVLADPKWRDLLPPRLVSVVSGDTRKAMTALENHPVLGAYAVAMQPPTRRPLVMEWDVHLHTPRAMAAVAAGVAGLRGWEEVGSELVRTTIVHHGAMDLIAAERLAGWNWYAYPRAAARGGLSPPEWVREYEAALHAGTGRPPADFAPLSVFLDVKTAGVTGAVLAQLCLGLNRIGIHVWGVGSFLPGQVSGFAAAAQRQLVLGAASPPPLALFLFGDAASIPHAGLPRGAAALFNGGSLLMVQGDAGREAVRYRVDDGLVAQLAHLASRDGLQLGWYVEEQNLDPQAATALVGVAEQHRDTFALGFAYSGVDGIAAGDIAPSPGSITTGWMRPWWAEWLGLARRRSA